MINSARAGVRIVIVGLEAAQILDITGPSEVFSIAERLAPGSYAVELVGPDGAEIRNSGASAPQDNDR